MVELRCRQLFMAGADGVGANGQWSVKATAEARAGGIGLQVPGTDGTGISSG